MRHAGDDADVGLLPDLEQRLGEDVQTAARQDLRRLHQGVCSDGRLGDVATEVRIQDEREDARLRHRDSEEMFNADVTLGRVALCCFFNWLRKGGKPVG